MPTRRQILLAGALGFIATPALGKFEHPVHSHAAKIEARLTVWRDHVAAQHDYLLAPRESHITRWREWSGKIPNKPEADLLAKRSDGSFWALDNLSDNVIPAEEMDLQPLYGVDSEGVWLFERSKAG
jgi:hypothetical protein